MTQINILDARNKLSRLIKSAAAGEEVVIAKRGVPVARLVKVDAEAGASGSGPRIAQWLDENPLPAHARRGPDEIAGAIETERAAWD